MSDRYKLYKHLKAHYDDLCDRTGIPEEIGEVREQLAGLGYELGLPGHDACGRCGSYLLPRSNGDVGGCYLCYDIAAGVRNFLRFVKWGPTGEPPPEPCPHGYPPGRKGECMECARRIRAYLSGLSKRPVG